MTHDYKRHGTTTLFAALHVLEGKVIGQCLPLHTNHEFLRFLRRLDREFPRDLTLHLILDNYGTHTHPNREITTKRIRRGVFHSVEDLIAAIDAYLQETNKNPKPFDWTASVETILAKTARCKAILETLH